MAATETRESRRDELLAMAETVILSPTSRRRLSGRRCNCLLHPVDFADRI